MSKLTVLMYHHISADKSEGLTISLECIEQQLAHLASRGYKTHHLKDLYNRKKLKSKKNVVITFDDVYVSQLELAYPLLKKYGLKATFFAPLSFIGKKDSWNTGTLEIMTVAQLRSMDSSIIELGFHSFYHKKYHELTFEDIEEDTRLCKKFVSENSLEMSPVVAYPYGKYPRDKDRKITFFKQLQKHGFVYGLRIGNRVNKFPFKNPFEIQRIDVKGNYSLRTFKRKLRFGKLFG
ncbi:polysaccharide deacetylase family protein [Aquimarina sp. 2201CG1-2-11]|uniref:polysaccharide deacetylase family protein n=1 Tax=Aquimarina discodermiae TaxID=3231043 RepID=UPI00346297E1